MVDGISQDKPTTLNQSPETKDTASDAVLAYVTKTATELRTEATQLKTELKEEAKEQKSYLMLGFFILGVMVATMVIMVGGMVYGVIVDQNVHDAQLQTTLQEFMQTYGKK